MNHELVLRLAVLASVLMLIAGAIMLQQMSRQQRLNTRISQIQAGRIGAAKIGSRKSSARDAVQLLAGVGQGIMRSGAVSSQTADALQKKLEAAGIRSANAVGTFVAAKISLALVLPVLVFIGTHGMTIKAPIHNMMLGIAAIGGLLAPDYIVGSLRKRYQAAISAGLPDALDMLVMCAESGLSLEPAMFRVGTEIQGAHPAVSTEFLLTCSEFQVSTDSAGVLSNLGDRSGLPEMKRVVATLSQTLQYGTPLAEALRVLSGEMRTELLTKFEERAAKLPVLLTLPMIVFILPSLFLVIGGPAILQAMRMFSK
jgi:tight adherence protein C